MPFVTLAHHDHTRPAWGQLDATRLRETLWRKLCQICGEPLDQRVVLYLRPADYLRGIAPEPGLHPECGMYSKRACPMLAGHTHRYNPHPNHRRCGDPTCPCRLWAPTQPDEAAREGQPAEAWYEAWLDLDNYHIVSNPGDEKTPPLTGVNLRDVHFRKLRKIRDAASGSEDRQPLDLLAAIVDARTLFGSP